MMIESGNGPFLRGIVLLRIVAQMMGRKERGEPHSRVLLSQRAHDALTAGAEVEGPLTHVYGLRVVICPDADVYVPSDRPPVPSGPCSHRGGVLSADRYCIHCGAKLSE